MKASWAMRNVVKYQENLDCRNHVSSVRLASPMAAKLWVKVMPHNWWAEEIFRFVGCVCQDLPLDFAGCGSTVNMVEEESALGVWQDLFKGLWLLGLVVAEGQAVSVETLEGSLLTSDTSLILK